tara:strand:- start:4120 stop:4473 length:354 start_codon:yes stop_codon:yes gene_type:complete
MRHFNKLLAAAGLAIVMATHVYAETVSPQDASRYVGSLVAVEGIVSQVSKSGGTTFINFGGRYPNHVFYAVILRSNSGSFSDTQSLEGRKIAISGHIEFYKGKPQIVLRSPDQIELR